MAIRLILWLLDRNRFNSKQQRVKCYEEAPFSGSCGFSQPGVFSASAVLWPVHWRPLRRFFTGHRRPGLRSGAGCGPGSHRWLRSAGYVCTLLSASRVRHTVLWLGRGLPVLPKGTGAVTEVMVMAGGTATMAEDGVATTADIGIIKIEAGPEQASGHHGTGLARGKIEREKPADAAEAVRLLPFCLPGNRSLSTCRATSTTS